MTVSAAGIIGGRDLASSHARFGRSETRTGDLYNSSPDDPADVNQMHLPAFACMGRVDADEPAVGTESRMSVATVLVVSVFRR
jgi:hypothetical protein